MEPIDTTLYRQSRVGDREVWCNDKGLHRDGDQPAIVYDNGRMDWYQNGIPFRENGLPHVEEPCGTKIWYDSGLNIVMYETSSWKGWYLSGIPHREERDSDGLLLPAVERYNGQEDEYYLNGGRVDRCGGPWEESN